SADCVDIAGAYGNVGEVSRTVDFKLTLTGAVFYHDTMQSESVIQLSYDPRAGTLRVGPTSAADTRAIVVAAVCHDGWLQVVERTAGYAEGVTSDRSSETYLRRVQGMLTVRQTYDTKISTYGIRKELVGEIWFRFEPV